MAINKQVLHLKGLNGLRAIAALSVVFSHISLELKSFGLNYLFVDKVGNPKGLLMASYGVTIFFALSGFLITYLLLKEKERYEKISIKDFYIRRILRIWPLYYAFLLVTIVIYSIFGIDYKLSNLSLYVFIMANFALVFNMMLPYIGHLWSIGVEEQFYLFWPWIAKLGNKKLLKFSAVFITCFYLIKAALYMLSGKNEAFKIGLSIMNVTRFHIMLIGAVGAIVYYNKNNYLKYFLNKKVQLGCWLILFLCGLGVFQISSALIDHELIAFVTVLIILAQISRTNYIVDLDNKFFDFIGKISYGIYVIHPMIIFLFSKLIFKFPESNIFYYIITYSSITIVTIILSYLSYNVFEKRFILMKDKFAKIKSAA